MQIRDRDCVQTSFVFRKRELLHGYDIVDRASKSNVHRRRYYAEHSASYAAARLFCRLLPNCQQGGGLAKRKEARTGRALYRSGGFNKATLARAYANKARVHRCRRQGRDRSLFFRFSRSISKESLAVLRPEEANSTPYPSRTSVGSAGFYRAVRRNYLSAT